LQVDFASDEVIQKFLERLATGGMSPHLRSQSFFSAGASSMKESRIYKKFKGRLGGRVQRYVCLLYYIQKIVENPLQ